MIKYIGYIMIVLISYIIGQTIYAGYKQTHAELDTMQTILIDLINLMKHTPVSVDEVFSNYCKAQYAPYDKAFENMMTKVKTKHADVARLWEEEIKALSLCVKGEDLELVASIGSALCLPEKDRIIARLEIAKERLKNRTETAKQNITQRGDMFRKLSLIAGLFLVILLW